MNRLNRNISWFVLGVFCLLAILPIGFSQTGDYAYLGSVSTPRFLPSVIHSGDTVSMAVDVSNTGYLVAMSDVNVSLDMGTYFNPIVNNAKADVINNGTSVTMVFKFKVNDSVQPGYYNITLNLDYMRQTNPVHQSTVISVPVDVSQKNLSIEVNPRVINPGNQTPVTFSVVNSGSAPVSNISLSWAESSSLILPVGSDNQRFASSINPGEKYDFNYVIAADPTITTGIYPLTINLSYNDSTGTKTQSSKVGLIVGGATNFQVSADQTSGQISFSIANIGSNNASAMVVQLSKQVGLTISGSDTVVVGTLNKGDYSIANFTVQTATDLNNSFGSRNGRSTNAGSATDQPTMGGVPTQASSNPTQDFNANSGFGRQVPSSYTLDIYYTDTTGERQHVQAPFTLSGARSVASATGFGTSGRSAASGNELVPLVGVLLGILVIAGAYNQFKAKKSLKKNLKHIVGVVFIGVILPILIINFVSGFALIILSSVILVGALVYFFTREGK